MKKKVMLQLLILWLILPLGLAQAFTYQAVSNLKEWNFEGEWIAAALFDTQASFWGTGGWAVLSENYPNSVGIRATVNIENIVDFAGCGICKTVGTVGDNTVRACLDVGFGGWDGQSEISYYIALIDPDGYWVGTYEIGYLGEMQTITGRDITLEIARNGNEIWFTAPGYGVSKFEPTISLGQISNDVEFFVEDLTPGSEITVTLKDVSIVFPD